jgi:hypothetical protein
MPTGRGNAILCMVQTVYRATIIFFPLLIFGLIPIGSEAKMCVGHKQCALQNSILFNCKNCILYRIENGCGKNNFFYHDEKIARP